MEKFDDEFWIESISDISFGACFELNNAISNLTWKYEDNCDQSRNEKLDDDEKKKNIISNRHSAMNN